MAVLGDRADTGASATALVWLGIVWWLVWSQVSGALWRRVKGARPKGRTVGRFAALVIIGVGTAFALEIGLVLRAEAGPVELTIWSGLLVAAVMMAALVCSGWAVQYRPTILLGWFLQQRDVTGPAAALGAGLGLLWIRLVQVGGTPGWESVAWFGALVVAWELGSQLLIRTMRRALRTITVGPELAARVRRWILTYAVGLAAVPVALLASHVAGGWTGVEGLRFLLLAVAMASTFPSLALGCGRRHGACFLVAGLLALTGVPLVPVIVGLFLSCIAVVLMVSSNLPRCAVALLFQGRH